MIDKTTQSKLDSFLTLKSDIIQDVKSEYSKSGGKNISNAMSMASVNLVQNVDDDNFYDNKISLQEQIGPLTNFVGGKSVAQIRKEKRKSRSPPSYIRDAHLPSNSISNIVSPPSIKNNRFYNNNLCSPVNEPSTLAIIQSPESSVSRDSDSSNSKTKVLKRKIIRRLIDGSSPPTEKKKRCFNHLMAEDESAMEIIEIAVESNNSVEDTKKMLLNFI